MKTRRFPSLSAVIIAALTFGGCGERSCRPTSAVRPPPDPSGEAGGADPSSELLRRDGGASATDDSDGGAKATGRLAWVRRMGGPEGEVANSVEVDSVGNVYIAGYTEGDIDLGGGNLTGEESDILVASYTKAGGHRWSKRFGGSSSDRGEKVAIDSAGNVQLVAVGVGTFDIGGSQVACGETWGGLLASLTSDGDPRWARSSSKGKSWPRDMALDAAGNIFAVGSFGQDVQIAGKTLPSAGGDDIFVTATDADGENRWTRTLGTPEDDRAWAVTTDSTGNVYVTGTFTGELTLGSETVQGAGRGDIYLACFSPAGEPRWLRRWGDDGWDAGHGLTTDGAGNVYITGFISRAGTYHGGRPTYYNDIFLASLTSDGTERWAHRFQTRAGQGTDLAFGGRGNLCLAGSFSGGVNLGGGGHGSVESEELRMIPGGGEPHSDILVACFTEGGEYRWSRSFGGIEGDGGYAIAFGSEDQVYVTGFFQETVDFDGRSLTSTGGWDVFLLQLEPPL